MIAADTSARIDFGRGVGSVPARRLEAALAQGNLVMPMPVLFEILSGPGLTSEVEQHIRQLPRLEPGSGY